MRLLNSIPSVVLVSVILLTTLSFPTSPAAADDVDANATIVVNTAADEDASNSKCSLREAIIAANANTAYKGCPSGSGTDTITFAADYTITLSSQLPAITSSMIINGNGASKTIVQASTCNPVTKPNGCTPATYRVFEVGFGSNLTLTKLTIRHGNCTGACPTIGNRGGGIDNYGTLTIQNASIRSNFAEHGGGIYNNFHTPSFSGVTFDANSATLGGAMYNSNSNPTIQNTTFSGNSASQGGGMFNNYSNPTLTNVTFNGNSATNGGGIRNSNSSPTLKNTTFSSNSAEYGGGMYNGDNSAPILINVTINYNVANYGGGMYNHTSGPKLTNTLIANSLLGGDCFNVFSSLLASTNNLIEDSDYACGLSNGINSNIVGRDPNVSALANNGGATRTHALMAGSPAINKGTNTGCPAADQRGKKRPQGATCDIGAVEFVFPIYRSQGGNDGWVLESSETSGTGGAMDSAAATLNVGDDSANRQYRTVLSFNTAKLPDTAAITKVTLKVKKQSMTGGGNPINTLGGFMVDVKKGNFGKAALQLTDFNAKSSKTLGAFKPALKSGWYTLNLSVASAQINKTGNTQISLRFKLDDDNNAAANFLSLHSGNAGTASRPQLIIEYYVP